MAGKRFVRPKQDEAYNLKIDFDRIMVEIHHRVRDVVNQNLGDVYDESQTRVPVRKIYQKSKKITGTSRARFLTREEAVAEQAVRRELNAGVGKKRQLPQTLREIMQTQTLREPTRQAKVPTNPFLRVPRRINQPRMNDPDSRVIRQRSAGAHYYMVEPKEEKELSSRGRWELRNAHRLGIRSAAFTQKSGRTTLGGRLKGEIRVVNATAGETVVKGSVESPTYYARYVEFGTRHAAAQPYLRPALAKVREQYRSDLANALRRSGRGKRKHFSPKYGR